MKAQIFVLMGEAFIFGLVFGLRTYFFRAQVPSGWKKNTSEQIGYYDLQYILGPPCIFWAGVTCHFRHCIACETFVQVEDNHLLPINQILFSVTHGDLYTLI